MSQSTKPSAVAVDPFTRASSSETVVLVRLPNGRVLTAAVPSDAAFRDGMDWTIDGLSVDEFLTRIGVVLIKSEGVTQP